MHEGCEVLLRVGHPSSGGLGLVSISVSSNSYKNCYFLRLGLFLAYVELSTVTSYISWETFLKQIAIYRLTITNCWLDVWRLKDIDSFGLSTAITQLIFFVPQPSSSGLRPKLINESLVSLLVKLYFKVSGGAPYRPNFEDISKSRIGGGPHFIGLLLNKMGHHDSATRDHITAVLKAADAVRSCRLDLPNWERLTSSPPTGSPW